MTPFVRDGNTGHVRVTTTWTLYGAGLEENRAKWKWLGALRCWVNFFKCVVGLGGVWFFFFFFFLTVLTVKTKKEELSLPTQPIDLPMTL